jgi:hypothetical protein
MPGVRYGTPVAWATRLTSHGFPYAVGTYHSGFAGKPVRVIKGTSVTTTMDSARTDLVAVMGFH